MTKKQPKDCSDVLVVFNIAELSHIPLLKLLILTILLLTNFILNTHVCAVN